MTGQPLEDYWMVEHVARLDRLKRSELGDAEVELPDLPEGRSRRFWTIKQLGRPRKTEWLIPGWVAAGEFNVVYGQGDRFKSFLVLHWQLTAAREGRSCVYIAGEGAHGLRTRIPAWMRHHGVEADELDGFRVDAEPVLVDQEGEVAAWLREVEDELKRRPDWIVIDMLAMNFAGDENIPAEMGRFVRGVEKLRQAEGSRTAITVIHHTGVKGDRERGSAALRNGSFSMPKVLNKNGFRVEVECDRMKDAERPPKATPRMVKVEWEEAGDPVSSLAVDTFGVEETPEVKTRGMKTEKVGPKWRDETERVLAMEGRITKKSVAGLLKWNGVKAKRLLSSMVEAGDLRRQEDGRATWYQPIQ